MCLLFYQASHVQVTWCVCWPSEIHGHKPVATPLSEETEFLGGMGDHGSGEDFLQHHAERCWALPAFRKTVVVLNTCLSPGGRSQPRTGLQLHVCRLQCYKRSFITIFLRPPHFGRISRNHSPMDGGAWWAAVHGVAESRTRLSDFTFTFTFMHGRRKWQPTPVFSPGESQGWRSLVGCNPWGR